MHKALVATVASPKWAALKKKQIVNRAAENVMCGKYWKVVCLLLRAVFTLIKLICSTDSNILRMDKLYYLTSQTIAAAKKSKYSLGDKVLFPDSTLDNVALDDVANNDP